MALQNFSTTRDEFAGVALQPDGPIVAVGTWNRTVSKSSSEGDFLVARFHGDAVATSFSTSNAPKTGTPSPTAEGELSVLDTEWILSAKKKRPGPSSLSDRSRVGPAVTDRPISSTLPGIPRKTT